MTGPGFDTDPESLRGRAAEVARVEEAVRRAVEAGRVAGAPDAYGLLCSFFPSTVLGPVTVVAGATLGAGAAAAGALGDALHAAAASYESGDAAGASAFRDPRLGDPQLGDPQLGDPQLGDPQPRGPR